MKKILSAVLAVAFLFSVAPVFAAIEIGDGLTLSGVGNIFFQGGQRSYKALAPGEIASEDDKGNNGIYVGALTVTKTFEDGAEAAITIKAGSGETYFGGNDAQKNNFSNVVISGLWYQQPFLDNSLKVKVGRVGTIGGGNAVAGSADTQFINPMFTGEATKIGPWDSDGDAYGVVVTYSPIELIDISYNYAAANGQTSDTIGYVREEGQTSGGETFYYIVPVNVKGKTYSADKEGFNAIEVNVKPFENGNYKVAYWTLAEKVIYKDPITDVKESVNPSGLLFSIDQEVIENVSVFARFGLQLEEKAIDGDNNSTGWNKKKSSTRWNAPKQAWSLGGQVKGAFWSRDNDVIGAAVGQKSFTDRDEADYGAPVSKKVTPTQLITELYYKYTVSETVSVSPSFQYITYTDFGEVDNEFAYALRVNYSF